MQNIQFNGKHLTIKEQISIADFLTEQKIPRQNLILEWNGSLLTGSDPLEEHFLQNGDRLELFTMVGGG